ncbi:MAG: YidC/Oxa1 family membrane protein insertase [Defluviitaleaceae bacterium]|nr:YidC/Oxa1 family membrane protein insertase [Defluviitaleaceae bacterium]
MGFIDALLGVPLGHIIYRLFLLTNGMASALILFAAVVRVAIFPVSLVAHKNSIRLLQLTPTLDKLKRRYFGDSEGLAEAQSRLFKAERYNPLFGMVPLVAQLFILMGVFRGLGYAFRRLGGADLHWLGIDLAATLAIHPPSNDWIILALSSVSTLIFCLAQNHFSPGAISQSARTNGILTGLTMILSIYFTVVLPAGFGVYWTASNLFSIAVLLVLDKTHNPQKLAAEAIAHIQAGRKTAEQLAAAKSAKAAEKAREKQDAAAFNAAEKELVFYALSGGQYKYYESLIDYLLANSSTTIHYLTNDFADKIFEHPGVQQGRIVPYYASQEKTISLLLRLGCDIMVTTVQDLHVYHIKRSATRDDIEYIHLPHGPGSLHLTAREAAYDHFDTFFCVGEHQAAEIRRREEMAGLRKKRLVKAGYGLYDKLVERVAEIQPDAGAPKILIAPSWQPDNILDTECIHKILGSLQGRGYRLFVRPHPQFTVIYPELMEQLQHLYRDQVSAGEIIFDTDFLSSASIFEADLIITDWSGIAIEFSYTTLRPSIFINTPMKVLNPRWKDYGLVPLDISLREVLGVSQDINDLDTLGDTCAKVLAEKENYRAHIEEAVRKYIYYPGRHGEACGRYIITQLAGRRRQGGVGSC